ncbi:hypothetical protein NCTGTJJY_CDS0044 [Serratia phage 92A1]|nr:hypothetical protein NCTGTJJY_CDS0044 [Serratia phage 92A1]
MKKAVIVGAGLATRLYPITHHIPKVLVNYKQQTILKHLYDMYVENKADRVIVIVHSKFKDLVAGYGVQNEMDKLEIRTVDEALGSAYAISCIQEDIQGHQVIFNWCDIIPEFNEIDWNKDAIYTYGNECRFKYQDGEIVNVGKTGGDVVGVFQSQSFQINLQTVINRARDSGFPSEDYAEILQFCIGNSHIESPDKIELKSLVDLGDMPKLNAAHSVRELNREFNKVEFTSDTVIKVALSDKGLELQKDELEWYKKAKSNAVPEILGASQKGFVMTRIIGRPMFEAFPVSQSAQNDMVYNILSSMDFGLYTHHVERARVHQDMKKEVVDKVIDRCKSIEPMIKGFEGQTPITHVNSLKIGRLKSMLERALAFLVDDERTYTLIHGDPNFSNTMLDDQGKVKFIDPRGYFGHTKLFGPKIYDEAKVLYALSGYDKFNADHAWGGLFREGSSIEIDIEPLANIHNFKQFNDKHHIWLGVIWIALAGYFKNNPLKSLAAYYYGMYMLTTALENKGRKLQSGKVVAETDKPVTATLITKCPEKWLLIDEETGVHYRPSGDSTIGKQWKRV